MRVPNRTDQDNVFAGLEHLIVNGQRGQKLVTVGRSDKLPLATDQSNIETTGCPRVLPPSILAESQTLLANRNSEV